MISLSTNGHFHCCLSLLRNLMSAISVCLSRPLWMMGLWRGCAHGYALTRVPVLSLGVSVNPPSTFDCNYLTVPFTLLLPITRARLLLFVQRVPMTVGLCTCWKGLFRAMKWHFTMYSGSQRSSSMRFVVILVLENLVAVMCCGFKESPLKIYISHVL